MASDQLTLIQEQCAVIKCLEDRGLKAAEIYRGLLCALGEPNVVRSSIFERCKRFRHGREPIEGDTREVRPKGAVIDEAVQSVEQVILSDGSVSVGEATIATCIS